MPAPRNISKIKEIQFNNSELDKIEDVFEEKRFLFDNFIKGVKKDVESLNNLIEAYNKNKSFENLRAILMLRQKMNNTYNLLAINHCRMYQDLIHKNLFEEIQNALPDVGCTSLTQLTTESPPTLSPQNSNSLTEVIANMPHEKIVKLMTILWENQDVTNKINNLYAKKDPGYDAWNNFVKNHSLNVLSGTGNSRNLKVEPVDGSSPPVVLKVDMRRSQSKTAEDNLRKQNPYYLTNNYGVDRQANFSYVDEKSKHVETGTATLVITDFGTRGDLSTMIENIHKYEPNGIINATLDYFEQMANIMQDMQAKLVAFPDAKMGNWLIDDDNKLKIADTKSLLNIKDDGTVKEYSPENPHAGNLFTIHLLPPELGKEYISAEAMHVYLLGKNLYQALTHCKVDSLPGKREFNDSDFSTYPAVFRTPEGQELKNLIQSMVKIRPGDRISLQEAIESLTKIKQASLRKGGNVEAAFKVVEYQKVLEEQQKAAEEQKKVVEAKKMVCMEIIQEYKKLGLSQHSTQDHKLDKFISNKSYDIRNTNDLQNLEKIEKDLLALHKQLVPIHKMVKTTVEKFKTSWWINPYKNENIQKSVKINNSFLDIPVEDRVKLFSSKPTKEVQNFHNALSWHRKEQKYNEPEVADKKMTTTFTKFKERFGEITKQAASTELAESAKPTQPTIKTP